MQEHFTPISCGEQLCEASWYSVKYDLLLNYVAYGLNWKLAPKTPNVRTDGRIYKADN